MGGKCKGLIWIGSAVRAPEACGGTATAGEAFYVFFEGLDSIHQERVDEATKGADDAAQGNDAR